MGSVLNFGVIATLLKPEPEEGNICATMNFVAVNYSLINLWKIRSMQSQCFLYISVFLLHMIVWDFLRPQINLHSLSRFRPDFNHLCSLVCRRVDLLNKFYINIHIPRK
jgi:hypothetical protein